MTPSAPSRLAVARLPLIIGGIVVAGLVGAGTLIARASTDRTFALEPDYYRKALRWDITHAEMEASSRLGWVSTAEAAAAPRRLILTLSDKAGAPIGGAAITVELFASRLASVRSDLTLTEDAPGRYSAPWPEGPAGNWVARVRAVHTTDIYVTTHTVEAAAQ